MPSLMRPRPRQILPTERINSRALETMKEIAADIRHIDDLKAMISEHARECLELFERVEKEGVTDPLVIIDLLLIDDAIRNLNSRRELYTLLMQNRAIVLLPLPPHLSDAFLKVADPNLVFRIDRDLPPHLARSYARNLDLVTMSELQKLTEGIEAVVLEAYIEHDRLYVRETAVDLIYVASTQQLRCIFIHAIPQLPPSGVRFRPLEATGSNISLLQV